MDISKYLYINIPIMCGDLNADVKALLIANNRIKTFDHITAVANKNIEIAEMFGLKKDTCKISGYLHDISTVLNPDDMLTYAWANNWYIDESENRYPFLLHQRISKLIAQNVFNVHNIDILSSIECHSTLKSNPSDYDMALFIADKLSWDQEGIPPFYDLVKTSLIMSLEKGCLAYMNYATDNNLILYHHAWFIEGKKYLEKQCDTH